jgi:hypothetical protein
MALDSLDPNPALATTAPISWPAMHRIGTYPSMILSSLGFQLTEAASLLVQTKDWLTCT